MSDITYPEEARYIGLTKVTNAKENEPMKELFKPEPAVALIDGKQVAYDLCTVKKGMVNTDDYEYLGKGTSLMDLEGHYYKLKEEK